jgi:hypothetical protein
VSVGKETAGENGDGNAFKRRLSWQTIFRVASVNLTATQQQKIAAAIQGAVLGELAQLDLGATPPPADCLYRPIKWAGGIMIPPGELAAVSASTLTVTAAARTQS